MIASLIAQDCTNLVDEDAEEKAAISGLAIAEGIMLKACAITKLYPEDLRKKSRISAISRTRQAVAYAIKHRTDWSYPQICRYLNLKDHTTIIHACKMTLHRMVKDTSVSEFVEMLMTAEPVIPLSVSSALIASGVERIPAQPMRNKPKKNKAISAPALKVEKVPMMRPDQDRPKRVEKPKHVWERVNIDETKTFSVNQDGNDQPELSLADGLIEGSAKLRDAILNWLDFRTRSIAFRDAVLSQFPGGYPSEGALA
jgi:hypothetical protein